MMGRVADFGTSLRSKSALDRGEHPAKGRSVAIPFLGEAMGDLDLLENLQEGIWLADDRGRIVFANRALARLVGRDGPEALVGRPWYELLPEGSADRVAQLHPEADVPYVASFPASDNHRTSLTIAVFRRGVGEKSWYVGSALPNPTPVPGEGPAEQPRSDLMAMVFHDLRTPLAAISEALSLLSETAAGQLAERQNRYLTIARKETSRLKQMVDNLVEAYRIDSGRAALRIEAVDLPELLATAVESLSPLTDKRDLTVVRNVPSRLPRVAGDREGLLRVFSNILDNAIRHSPPGGTVSVVMDIVDPDAALLRERKIPVGTGYVQVTVSDDGPGIPVEALDRIFGKFERVDPDSPGIGLGLAIVRSIVELHHGRVWAESGLGGGAKFHFVLPIKENA